MTTYTASASFSATPARDAAAELLKNSVGTLRQRLLRAGMGLGLAAARRHREQQPLVASGRTGAALDHGTGGAPLTRASISQSRK